MNREFLDLFNQELRLLREQAGEFAAEYPGIAARLGGLVEERPDNMILGLLEGAAFLAARVQLKLKHEFPEFCNNLIEQLVPNYLAPTPSVMLAKVMPRFGDPALRESWHIPRGSYLDAVYRQRERQVTPRYRLTSDIRLWPLDITDAAYYATPAPLQALGLDVGPDIQAGLRLTFTLRTAPDLRDEPPANAPVQPEQMVAGLRIRDLPVFLLGQEADAAALYKPLIADCAGIHLRWLDSYGDPVRPFPALPPGTLEQIGFSEEESLLPNDNRIFRGFDLLREYFMFPRKFLGFRLKNLEPALRRVQARSFDLLFTFTAVNPKLMGVVRTDRFALYAAPAINLFEKDTDRIAVKSHLHEYHVVPDRSRLLEIEPHQVLDVHAHYPGGRAKVRVPPLYSAAADGTPHGPNLFYTVRRLPRRPTIEEKARGFSADYMGTDMFLSLVEPATIDDETPIAELSLRALCSNRHLPEQMPVGTGGADFNFVDNTELDVVCIDGPTPPREPVIANLRNRPDVPHTGAVSWRLINMLALNHLGLVERGAGRGGQALRDTLSMFADMGDSAMEKRIRGVRGVDSRPVVRRIRRAGGIGAARGIEVGVTLDDRAFEGSSTFLLGAVLDRFFAEYAPINSFTQTVIRTAEWGELHRWPVRAGVRGGL